MRIQVVHCHPLTSSYNHALFEAIVEALAKNGHQVVATDLYREGFQPAMTERERATYMREDYDRSAVADYCETLKSVDGLILCFPHWWFSMPAMLKGWVDRVWGPGIAFDYDPKDNHLRLAVVGRGPVRGQCRQEGADARHEADVRQGRALLLYGALRHGPFEQGLAARLPRQGPAANVAAIVSAP
jgi:putative NADPH-quinone reductase